MTSGVTEDFSLGDTRTWLQLTTSLRGISIRGNADLVLGADGLELAARWELSGGGVGGIS